MLLAFITAQGRCRLMFSLLCVRTTFSSSAVLLSSLLIPIIKTNSKQQRFSMPLAEKAILQADREAMQLCDPQQSPVFPTVHSCFFLAVWFPLDVRVAWEEEQASVKLQVERSVSGRSQIVHCFIRIIKNNTSLFSQTHLRNWQRLHLLLIFFSSSIFCRLSFGVWKRYCLKLLKAMILSFYLNTFI